MFAKFINQYWSRDYGNAALDWMVLTTGMVLLSVAVAASVFGPDGQMAIQTEIPAISAFGV